MAVAVHGDERDPKGIEACRGVAARWPTMPVVVIGLGDRAGVGAAVAAFASGAFDFLPGPVDRTEVADALVHAAEMGALRASTGRRLTPLPGTPVERRHLLGLDAAVMGHRLRTARILGADEPARIDPAVDPAAVPSTTEDVPSRTGPSSGTREPGDFGGADRLCGGVTLRE